MALNNLMRLLMPLKAPLYSCTRKYLYSNLKKSHVYHLRIFKRYLAISNVLVDEADTKLSEAILQQTEQRIYKKDVVSVIENIKKEGLKNFDNGILLLKCCGHLIPDELPENRLQMLEDIWGMLRNKNVDFNVQHYNMLLQSYIENGKVLSYKQFLNEMTCAANKETYCLLLESACENGDIAQATEIIGLMKDKEFSASESVFSSLILGYLKARKSNSARDILETMRISQLELTEITYTALLRGYAETLNITEFTKALQKSSHLNFHIDQILAVVRSVCASENREMLYLIKKNWASRIDFRVFESKLMGLCIQLIHLNKPEVAYDAYEIFIDPDVGLKADSDSYAGFLLHEMVKADTPESIIINIADDLIKSERNEYALFRATYAALSKQSVGLSIALLQALHDRKITLRSHYFWPILIEEGKMNGENGLFKIFNLMQDLNVHIDSETLETYSLQYIKNIDSSVLLGRLKQFNLAVSEVLTPLCIVLIRANRIKDAVNLCQNLKIALDNNRFIKPLASGFIATQNVDATVALLNHMNEHSKNHNADWQGQVIFLVMTRSGKQINYANINKLLKAYKSNNLTISSVYAERIENLCKKIKNEEVKLDIEGSLEAVLNIFDNNEHNNAIPHPRDMNLDELECHLIELKNKNMETRGVLRKLIQMHCRFGNLDRVNALCDEFYKCNYSLSPGMKASLLDLYLKNDKFEDAWKLYNDIKVTNPTFVLDEFKVINLATLLINNDLFEDALKIVALESSNRRMRGGKSIEHNCWSLLNTIANTGNATHTQLMYDTLIEKRYCSESNTLLGPLVRAYLNNDNLAAAIEKFVKCATQYNKTPLLHELLCKLSITKAPVELIQKIVDASTKVHGIPCTNMALVAALAETGQRKTLRKLFLDLKVQLPIFLFEQYCEKWVKDNNITVFNNILECAKGISIDVSTVYTSLMRLYSINNDCDSALQLWNDILDQQVPPKKVKNILIALLQSNEHPQLRTIKN